MKIEIKNLKKVFRSDSVQTIALNGVSLSVDDGEFVAVMGPSGCGKSTLLNILGLLDNPTSGEYLLGDTEVGSLRESQRTAWRRGRIGFIFQSFNLIEEMNIRDNIMLPLNSLDLPKAEKNRRVEEAAIARAIVSEPGLILADEPTGNLDSRNGAEVMELLSELHRAGATIVMVTHSQKDAALADRIINLFDGQIVENLNDRM